VKDSSERWIAIVCLTLLISILLYSFWSLADVGILDDRKVNTNFEVLDESLYFDNNRLEELLEMIENWGIELYESSPTTLMYQGREYRLVDTNLNDKVGSKVDMYSKLPIRVKHTSDFFDGMVILLDRPVNQHYIIAARAKTNGCWVHAVNIEQNGSNDNRVHLYFMKNGSDYTQLEIQYTNGDVIVYDIEGNVKWQGDSSHRVTP